VDFLLGTPEFTRIIALVRRPIPKEIPIERLRIATVDFDQLEKQADLFGAENIFCALGTTMRQAGSEAAFRRVDYEYPLSIARLGLAAGAKHFLLVSAAGANAASRIFYNRVKGELEDSITGLGYQSLTIIRPSFLLGERTDVRRMERLAGRLAFLTPARYRPVAASKVAASLVEAASGNAPGRRIIENNEIR
jgi:uncharacterized protein YbjT (DUF2867 family)